MGGRILRLHPSHVKLEKGETGKEGQVDKVPEEDVSEAPVESLEKEWMVDDAGNEIFQVGKGRSEV